MKLESNGFPRLQMLSIVTITGSAGFLSSYSMLQAGLTEMWLRYLCAIGIAYLVFLILLWLWLRTTAKDYTDVPDIPGLAPSRSGDTSACYSGKGGNFGGGGASGSYDRPTSTSIALDDSSTFATLDSGGPIGDALGAAAKAEEFAIPLMVFVMLVAILSSAFIIIYSVIYSAPVFFAELLLDGVLSASLYRKLRGLETRHWLETAIRRTATPFMATALIITLSGWGMNLYAPEAHSIGDVIAHAKHVQ